MSDKDTSKYAQPWSVVNNSELAKLRTIATLAKQLGRGCSCDYDHRCGNCQVIVSIHEILEVL